LRSEMPDLVLLDVDSPPMDGWALLEQIRRDPAISHIPVIVLSAAHRDRLHERFGPQPEADEYLIRPFDRQDLFARIRTKLGEQQSETDILELAEQTVLRQNRLLTAAAEIASAATSTLDPKGLLIKTVELIQEKFAFYH